MTRVVSARRWARSRVAGSRARFAAYQNIERGVVGTLVLGRRRLAHSRSYLLVDLEGRRSRVDEAPSVRCREPADRAEAPECFVSAVRPLLDGPDASTSN